MTRPATTTPPQTGSAGDIALLIVLATLWGGSYTFIKIGVETIPPARLNRPFLKRKPRGSLRGVFLQIQ